MKVAEAALADPCGADWRTMHPRGDRARLCAECSTLVHDLSSMSEAQARALLQRPRNERLCIRYLHDAHGKVWFNEGTPQGLVAPASLLRRRLAALAGATALVVTPTLVEACGGANPYDGTSEDGGGAPTRLLPASPSVTGPADAAPETTVPDAGAGDTGTDGA